MPIIFLAGQHIIETVPLQRMPNFWLPFSRLLCESTPAGVRSVRTKSILAEDVQTSSKVSNHLGLYILEPGLAYSGEQVLNCFSASTVLC